MLQKHKETAEKVAARAFAQGFMADLVPQVVASLTTHGFFCDPVEMGECVGVGMQIGVACVLVAAVARVTSTFN